MADFLGMALYTKEEIGSALDNYRLRVNTARGIVRKQVALAESEYQPSWWYKLWRELTLFEKYTSERYFMDTYHGWLHDNKYITFSKEDESSFYDIDRKGWGNFYMSLWETEYNQVKDLFNGGKDCYLNPTQCRFVNKFKVNQETL